MSLYEDLTEILTPYADKINQNAASLDDLRDDLDNLDVETDKTLTLEDSPADAKAVGDAVDGKADKDNTPKIINPDENQSDLYICDSNGNVIVEFLNGHIATKEFNSSNIQFNLLMESNSDIADLYIVDSFGNAIIEFINGHIVTKKFNSSDYSSALSDIAELLSDVATLQSATSGILYRTKAQTDGVYATCMFNVPARRQFCLLIAGDSHTNPTQVASMFEYFNAIDAFNAGIMLGDISGNTFADSIEYYTTPLATVNKPFLTVLGNHDVYGATSNSDLYGKYGNCLQYAQLTVSEEVSGKCYYYKDFATYKIRIIVLMQYDYTFTGNLCFGQDQIDWFIQSLASTPSDYGVIIAEHTNPSRYMDYVMDGAVTSSTWKRSNYAPTDMSGDVIPDIVDAWINGGALTQTYSYTYENPPSDLSVNVDFSQRGVGEFITYIGGHWHQNVLGAVQNKPNQPDFHVQAVGLNTASGDIPRKSGTVSEDSFCALAVDRDNKTVKVFQVGAHYTKDAVDRQYFKYQYGIT